MASAEPIEENKQIIGRFVDEVINGQNHDRIEAYVDENVADHTPFGDTEGIEAFRETTEAIHAAFPDFEVTPEEIISEENTVSVRMTQRGTHEGEFLGVAPTGNSFEIKAMAFVHMEDGMLVERWVQPDVLGLMQQLGAVEMPGQ